MPLIFVNDQKEMSGRKYNIFDEINKFGALALCNYDFFSMNFFKKIRRVGKFKLIFIGIVPHFEFGMGN